MLVCTSCIFHTRDTAWPLHSNVLFKQSKKCILSNPSWTPFENELVCETKFLFLTLRSYFHQMHCLFAWHAFAKTVVLCGLKARDLRSEHHNFQSALTSQLKSALTINNLNAKIQIGWFNTILFRHYCPNNQTDRDTQIKITEVNV